MRLVRFKHGGRVGQGFVEGGRIIVAGDWSDLPPEDAPFDLPTWDRAALERALTGGGEEIALEAVTLLAPLASTAKVICLGVNYRDHAAEVNQETGDCPPLFAKYPDTLAGHEEAIIRPRVSDTFDFEGEIAIVIGKPGRHIVRESAMDHVLGYSCLMDGSIREYQAHSPTAGKNFYRSSAMGPWIVTADEVADTAGIELVTRLNGEIVQSAVSGDMIFDIPTAIAYISRWTPLRSGDVISTGTPAGVGWGRTPQLWMKPGDTIEVALSGIGTLRNSVVDEQNEAER
jgi:2-keto-4-pentenoate hydratase/2-oxohepta-3-ene-1,7-dioic acid hydratase in catechol pathway